MFLTMHQKWYTRPVRFTTLFFDLDDTLYPPDSGVWDLIRQRIDRYLLERMHFDRQDIPHLRRHFFENYGTTLRGLQTLYNVDELDYLNYVHDIPVGELLSPNPGLRSTLLRYPQQKIIFTNADASHARRVLTALGLEDCFEGIVDILDLTPYCKPQPGAFLRALHLAGNPDPVRCLLVEDSPANLVAARELGFGTIQVHQGKPCPGCNAVIASVDEIGSVLDRLLEVVA